VNRKRQVDAIVFGDGPAGTTVARCLAALGHSVCISQREQRTASPNARWETLSPGALELLRLHHEEAWPAIERLVIPCRATVLWTRDDARKPAVHRGMLVDRRGLDLILRASATAVGAVAIHRDPLPLSRFVVDAGGRSSAFPAPRSLLGPRTLALTARIAGSDLATRSTRVESLADGWLWAGRGDDAHATVTLFLSPRTVRSWPHKEHPTHFFEILRSSSLAASKSASRIVSNIVVRDATPAATATLADSGIMRAGDAALALDPLSGQGLQHAFVSAAQVAIVLHTMLAREESSALAQEFYRARHAEAAGEHALSCRAFYKRQDRFNGEFWRERLSENSLPSLRETRSTTLDVLRQDKLILSHEVRWKEVPVIKGDFIESEHALCHPSLMRPIAYLEGRVALDMLAAVSGEITPRALLQGWAERAPWGREVGLRALQFLVHHGILLPAGPRSGCQSEAALPLSSTSVGTGPSFSTMARTTSA
jgi:flavin-dependent dehydrogenase